jgi:hypothetical protein
LLSGASVRNYLIDLEHAVIMDVAATTAIRQAEVSAAKAMLYRTAEQFDVTSSRLVADGPTARPCPRADVQRPGPRAVESLAEERSD